MRAYNSWFWVHLFFTAVLLLLIALQLNPEPASAQAIDGSEPVAKAAAAGLEVRAEAQERGWLQLEFSAPMVEEAVVGQPLLDGSLAFVPHRPFTAHWRSPRRLRVRLVQAVLQPSLLALQLRRPWRATTGAELPAGLRLEVPVHALQVRGVSLRERDGDVPPDLILALSSEVAIAKLRAHLQLSRGGVQLPFGLEAEGPGTARDGAMTYRIRLDAAAGTAPVALRLRAGLGRGDPRLRLAVDYHKALQLRRPLGLLRCTAEAGRIDLHFGRALPLPARSMIRLEPTQEFQVRSWYRGLRLVGDFAPGTAVQVRLAAGFPGRGLARLAAATKRGVLIPAAPPRLRLPQSGSVLSARARLEVRIQGDQVAQLGLALRRLHDNNVLHYLRGRTGGLDRYFAAAETLELRPAQGTDGSFDLQCDLRPHLGSAAQGFYHLRVWDRDGRARSRSRVIQITDLRVGVQRCGASLAVLATRISDGRPVAGAEVQVVSLSNQGLVYGRTDARGMVLLEAAEDLADRRPALVMVRKGAERGFVDLQSHATELSSPGLAGREYLGPGATEAYVALSRGVVRPGGTLHGAVLLRDGAARAPAGRSVQLRLVAPGGRLLRRLPLRLNGTGFGRFDVAIPAAAPTGTWRLEVWAPGEAELLLGRALFLVEAFVPERLEAEAEVLGVPTLGAVTRIAVQGRWLDGSPAAGRPVRVKLRVDPQEPEPPGQEGWRFACVSRKGWVGRLPALRGMLDAVGRAEFSTRLPARDDLQGARLWVEVEVDDPSGRVVRTGLHLPVRQAGALFGLQRQGSAVALVCVDAGGQAVPVPAGACLSVEQRRWISRRVARQGHWRYESEIVAEEWERHELAPEQRRVELRRSAPLGSGWLVAVLQHGERRVELPLAEVPQRPDRLRIETLQEQVEAGQTARFELVSPVAGHCWLTLQGRRIHAMQGVAVQPGSNQIEVPVPAGIEVPNLFVVGVLSRAAADQAEGPRFLQGACALQIDRRQAICRPELNLPAEVRPETPFEVQVRAPGARDVALFLVDVGVLNITGHQAPDPRAHFLAQRRLLGRGADTGAGLLDGQRFRQAVENGGGDGIASSLAMLAGSMSSEIRPLAVARHLRLDAAGEGRVRLRLPAYEGRVRVMAVVSGAAVCGAASADLRVRSPLSLRLTGPRILRVGDRCELPLTVFSHRVDGVAELEVEAVAGSVGGAAALDLPSRLQLAKGVGRTLPLRLQVAKGVDAVELRIRARLADESAAVSLRIPVRDVAVYSTERRGMWLRGPQRLELGAGWQAAGFRFRARVDASPELALAPSLQALLGYPHGCLEQTTSKAWALLACQDLLPRILGAQAPEVEPLVQAGVDRILSMQQHHGGFAWWPRGRREYDFGTVQAAQFLTAAKARGLVVDEAALRKAYERVRHHVGNAAAPVRLRCLGLWVLAQAQLPTEPFAAFLRDQAEAREARLHVALALLGRGKAAELRRYLQHREPGPQTAPARALASPIRVQALQLRFDLAAGHGPGSMLQQVRTLQDAICRPRRCNTQELGQALIALAAYYRTRPRAQGEPVLWIRQGTQAHKVEVGAARELALDPTQRLELSLEGGGSAALDLSWSGLRRPQVALPPSGWSLGSQVFDAESGEPASAFKKGRLYELRVRLEPGQPLENLLLTQVLPAGFELERRPSGQRRGDAAHVECRDDRLLIFVPGRVVEHFEHRQLLRAVFPGRYRSPGLSLESMYEPDLRMTRAEAEPVEIAR